MTELKQIPPETLENRIEALLFVAPGPVTPNQLASALECKTSEVEQSLSVLDEVYKNKRSLGLQRHGGRVQLTTSPHMAELVERFMGLEVTSRLSQAALEALSIVAYRQPITRPGIDSIRGVNSDGVLKSLLSKGLIQEVGRVEGPGRPILYGVTNDFLQHFGLSSVNELPPFNQDEDPTGDPSTDNGVLKD